VFAEPVDGLVAFEQGDTEDAAVLAVGARQRLVSEVEEVGSEAEDGVEAAVLAEDGAQLQLLVRLSDAVDEVLEEVVDGELPLGEVHALGSELGDGVSDAVQRAPFVYLVVPLRVLLVN
jgi:hypothetical protein